MSRTGFIKTDSLIFVGLLDSSSGDMCTRDDEGCIDGLTSGHSSPGCVTTGIDTRLVPYDIQAFSPKVESHMHVDGGAAYPTSISIVVCECWAKELQSVAYARRDPIGVRVVESILFDISHRFFGCPGPGHFITSLEISFLTGNSDDWWIFLLALPFLASIRTFPLVYPLEYAGSVLCHALAVVEDRFTLAPRTVVMSPISDEFSCVLHLAPPWSLQGLRLKEMPVDSETDVGLGLLDVKGRKIACAMPDGDDYGRGIDIDDDGQSAWASFLKCRGLSDAGEGDYGRGCCEVYPIRDTSFGSFVLNLLVV